MLNQLQRKIYAWATVRNALLAAAAFIFMHAVVMNYAGSQLSAASGGVGPFDLTMGYSPDKANAMLAAYGESGRQIYLVTQFTADLVYPITYGLLVSLVTAVCLKRLLAPGHAAHKLVLLIWLAVVFDYGENIGIIAMLLTYPGQPSWLIQLSSLLTLAKWALVIAGGTVYAAALSRVIGTRRALAQGRSGPAAP